jgi:hypothetical protein
MITEHFVAELQDLQKIRHWRRNQISKYPSLEIIMASRRPDYLLKILPQLEKQSLPEFVISIGVHGYELRPQHFDLIHRLENRGISVTVQSFENSVTLGSILTTLADASDAKFIAKIDDDDIYGPEYLQDSLDSIIVNNADVVGRALNYIYLRPIDLTVRCFDRAGTSRVELWTDWICGGTILATNSIGRESRWFGEAKSGVDQYFLKQVSKIGGRIWRTYGAGYIYCRSKSGHTYDTNYSKYLESSQEQHVGLWVHEIFGTNNKIGQ